MGFTFGIESKTYYFLNIVFLFCKMISIFVNIFNIK